MFPAWNTWQVNVSQHLLHKFKSTNEKNLITSKKMLISEFQIVFASQQNNIYGASHDNSPTKEKGKRLARCIVAPSNNWFNLSKDYLYCIAGIQNLEMVWEWANLFWIIFFLIWYNVNFMNLTAYTQAGAIFISWVCGRFDPKMHKLESWQMWIIWNVHSK